MTTQKTKYASVSWSVSDLEMFDATSGLSSEQCELLLKRYEKLIRDAMVRAGWDVLEQITDPAWRESLDAQPGNYTTE